MPKKKPRVKTIKMISPVPSSTVEAVVRPVTQKRVSRLRANWFLVGSIFGVAISFFMNFLVTVIVMPEYQALTGRMHGEMHLAGETPQTAPETPIDMMAAATVAATAQEPSYPRNLTLKVGDGDTLVGMLLKNHVPSTEAHNVVAALKAQFNPKSLKVGQKISLTLSRHETLDNAAAVKELAIKLPNLNTVELARAENGDFSVASVKAELKDRAYRGYGTVKTSLFQAGADGGIPNGAMAEIVQAFSYDVDFQRDIHPGDSIEAILDRKENAEGKVGGYGNVRYAALTLSGKKHEIYSFKDSYGVAWYDAKGNSVKKSLLRTPINAARITSGFGMREHPILGYSKMHKGVDFGALQGTPIMAAGDGIVKQKGWVNGYGNFVLLQHNNTYSTAYGHMSRFATIQVGGRVKQGQVIGYVGMTGRATGPHLHYEVRQNNIQVNPAARQFNLASGLTGKQLAAFNANKAAVAKEMAALDRSSAQVASR
jgi:murein DD-endopeptidase MepM/ murein hydrolase activator NlpD